MIRLALETHNTPCFQRVQYDYTARATSIKHAALGGEHPRFENASPTTAITKTIDTQGMQRDYCRGGIGECNYVNPPLRYPSVSGASSA